MELGKLAKDHRTAPGELLGRCICARHVTVLIVEHRPAEMLSDIGGPPIFVSEAVYSSMGKS